MGIFREIDNFIENCLNLAKFYVILQFLTLECWVLELKLFISAGLCRPPPPAVATSLLSTQICDSLVKW